MNPGDIKLLCPRCQKRKDNGRWHLPASCRDCRLLNAKSVFKVRRKRCDTCIYGPTSASRASVEQLEAEVADPRMAGHFRAYRECHHHDGEGVCCRGFWDAHKDDFDAGQLAQRLNLVELVS